MFNKMITRAAQKMGVQIIRLERKENGTFIAIVTKENPIDGKIVRARNLSVCHNALEALTSADWNMRIVMMPRDLERVRFESMFGKTEYD